jgi:hypothetical protein
VEQQVLQVQPVPQARKVHLDLLVQKVQLEARDYKVLKVTLVRKETRETLAIKDQLVPKVQQVQQDQLVLRLFLFQRLTHSW